MNSFHSATVVTSAASVIPLGFVSLPRTCFGAGGFRGTSKKLISLRRFLVGALMPAFDATGKLFHEMMKRGDSYKLKQKQQFSRGE